MHASFACEVAKHDRKHLRVITISIRDVLLADAIGLALAITFSLTTMPPAAEPPCCIVRSSHKLFAFLASLTPVASAYAGVGKFSANRSMVGSLVREYEIA